MSVGDVLVLRHREDMHRIYGVSAVLGRSNSCDVRFDFTGISRRHCELILSNRQLIVRDLGSQHGTYVDGRRVVGEAPAGEGSLIRLTTRGPEIEVMRAACGGKTVLAPDPPTVAARVDPPAAGGDTQRASPAAVKPPAKTRVAATAAAQGTTDDAAGAPRKSRFFGGLVTGLALGTAIALAAVTYVEALDPLLQQLRDALGLS